jgi:hypothetical protein
VLRLFESTTVALDTSSADAVFLARVDHNASKFVATAAEHCDGIVLLSRFAAPHWPNSQAALRGLDGGELARLARIVGVAHIYDPDTWLLPHLEGHADRSLSRAPLMPCAQGVPLPLRASYLDDAQARVAFCGACLASQAGAGLSSVPYFEFERIDDEWFTLNIRCIQTMVRLSARPLAIFVRVPLSSLLDRTLRASAQRYAAVAPPGSFVFLTVGGLDPHATADHVPLAEYLSAVDAFAAEGLQAMADRVSEFGPAAVAIGARGCVSGTCAYRHAPISAHHDPDRKARLKVQYVFNGGRRVSAEMALRWIIQGRNEPCSHACSALNRSDDKLLLRDHHAHTMQDDSVTAQMLGPAGYAEIWEAEDRVRPALWAQALREADRLRRAA